MLLNPHPRPNCVQFHDDDVMPRTHNEQLLLLLKETFFIFILKDSHFDWVLLK